MFEIYIYKTLVVKINLVIHGDNNKMDLEKKAIRLSVLYGRFIQALY